MDELKLDVPTYYGSAFAERDDARELPEFGKPTAPILAHRAEELRIVLGTHDFEDELAPDIQIERRPNGWAIFLHPMGGGDPCGFLYFLDDGRSFLMKGVANTGTPEIETLGLDDDLPGIDDLDRLRHVAGELTTERIKGVVVESDYETGAANSESDCPGVIVG